MTEIKHWVDSSKWRSQFWATANELGLTKEQVYEAIEVEHVHDYEGTAMEAIAALHSFVMFKGKGDPPEAGTQPPELAPPLLSDDEPEEYDPFYPDDINPIQEHTKTEAEIDQEITDQLTIAGMVAEQPEAPIVMWTNFIDQKGYKWSFTVRPGLPDDVLTALNRSAMVQIGNFHKVAKAYNWVPEGGYLPARQAPNLELVAPPKSKPVGPAQPEPDPTDAMIKVLQEGEAALENIIVVDGVVEYKVEGLKWPLKDHRGIETADKVFDPSAANWRPSNLEPGKRYSGQGARVDWEQIEKNGKKYYNVVRVWAA